MSPASRAGQPPIARPRTRRRSETAAPASAHRRRVRALVPRRPMAAGPAAFGTSPGPVVGSLCSGYAGLDWGPYTAAVRRWETIVGRPAPAPTAPARTGRHRLAARFVEWLQGLPDGWVIAVLGLSHADQLAVLGNGVVPQQAAHAVTPAVVVDRLACPATPPPTREEARP